MAYTIKVKNNDTVDNVTWGGVTIAPLAEYFINIEDIRNDTSKFTDRDMFVTLARAALDGDITITENGNVLTTQQGADFVGKFYDNPYRFLNYVSGEDLRNQSSSAYNWDTITKSGVYRGNGSTTNGPSSFNGYESVFVYTTNDGGYIVHTAINGTGVGIASRRSNDSGSTWSTWEEYVTDSDISSKADSSTVTTHTVDATKHREINDAGTSSTETWSANKVNTELNNKEDDLGNPSINGYVLSSTTGGTRSWVEMSGGGGGSSIMTFQWAFDGTLTNSKFLWPGAGYTDGTAAASSNSYWEMPYAGQIVAITVSCLSGTGDGSNVGFDIWKNGTSVQHVGGFDFGGQGKAVILGTPISVAAGDEIALETGSSTWSLNNPKVMVFVEKS